MRSVHSNESELFNDLVNREIKVWMVRRGEDLLTLAAKTGISKSKLSRTVYRSEGSLPIRDFKTVCAALNVDMTVIISAADNAMREQTTTPLTDAQQAAQILARAEAAELEVTERILSAWLWEHSRRGGLDS
jgi:hypothetical protein